MGPLVFSRATLSSRPKEEVLVKVILKVVYFKFILQHNLPYRRFIKEAS